MLEEAQSRAEDDRHDVEVKLVEQPRIDNLLDEEEYYDEDFSFPKLEPDVVMRNTLMYQLTNGISISLIK